LRFAACPLFFRDVRQVLHCRLRFFSNRHPNSHRLGPFVRLTGERFRISSRLCMNGFPGMR
jgi:hypothetical protein